MIDRIPNMSCGSIPIRPSKHRSHDLVGHQLNAICSYGAAEVGVATAKTPCGPYTYKSSFKPLGADSRDMSLFQDGISGFPSPVDLVSDSILMDVDDCGFDLPLCSLAPQATYIERN